MSTKKFPKGWRPKSVLNPPPFQVHVVSKDEDWSDKLKFICAALQCAPSQFFRDIVPIHYDHIIAGIRRNLDEQGVKRNANTEPGVLGADGLGDPGAETTEGTEGETVANRESEEGTTSEAAAGDR